MHHHVAMAVLYARNDLLEEAPCFFFKQPSLLNNVVKELSSLQIWHQQTAANSLIQLCTRQWSAMFQEHAAVKGNVQAQQSTQNTGKANEGSNVHHLAPMHYAGSVGCNYIVLLL